VNLGDMKDRVRQSLGAASDELTSEVLRFIIDSLLDIDKAGRWPWNRSTETVTARGRLSFNATWTKATTTVTTDGDVTGVASQADADLYVGGLIQLNGSNIYEISAWTYASGNDTITVTPAIIDATASAATACLAIQDNLTLPLTVSSVKSVTDMLLPRQLVPQPSENHSRFWPNPFELLGAWPERWFTRGSSSGAVELVLFPPASEDRVYFIDYYQTPTLPTSSTLDAIEMDALTGIPEKFHSVVVAGAIAKALQFDYENIEQVGMWKAEFQLGLRDMRKYARTDVGKVHAMGSSKFRSAALGYTETGKVDV